MGTPRTGSLGLLLFAVGTTLIVWTLVNLAIQLLNTTSFAVIFFRLYRELSPDQALDIERLAARVPRTERQVTGPDEEATGRARRDWHWTRPGGRCGHTASRADRGPV